ncbi:MAG: pentapeptide repeat-containing protein, partial [Cyanobacteria bacterium J06558_2]
NKPIIQCTRATNAEFIGANLRYADFTKASLKGADFSHADLECASFRGAIFNKEQQESKDLSESIKPTNFTDANLKGADLRDLAISTDGDKRGILPEQIKKAKNWKQAQYSDAFLTDELGLSKEDHQPHNCETFQK